MNKEQTITGVIRGTGACVPERILDNKEIAGFVDTSDEWIRERTGVRRRRIAEKETTVRSDGVEVLCFHSKQRCATCIAIEKNARTAIDSAFADRLADGTLSFRIIDISKPENEAIAEKYQVTWSSLYIVSHKNGQEKAENMTEFAFSNARKSPGEFKKGLVDKINEMIN